MIANFPTDFKQILDIVMGYFLLTLSKLLDSGIKEDLRLTLPVPIPDKEKINLNFYFHTSL